jgi:branched-chain amino acid aminotransferase
VKVLFNGELIEEKDAVIPISDKGYFYDFAVYSSLKVLQGRTFFPEYHIDRLLESAKQIDLLHPFSKEKVLEWLQNVIKENGLTEALIRVILIGDTDNNETTENNAKLYLFPVTGVTFYPNSLYTNGAKAITYKAERRLPTVKSKDLLLSFMAMRDAKKHDAIEALLIDRDGNIREGTRSNFYAVSGSTIILPPKEKILDGIVQQMVLKVIQGHYKVSHEDIPLASIKKYNEFFLTSTLFNIMPVSQIDDVKVASDFTVTKHIMKLYKDFYRKEILEK